MQNAWKYIRRALIAFSPSIFLVLTAYSGRVSGDSLNGLATAISLIQGIVLMPFLIFINLKTDPQTQWFWFPLIGCGLSVLGYGLYLFAGKSWEERKIRQIMNKQK